MIVSVTLHYITLQPKSMTKYNILSSVGNCQSIRPGGRLTIREVWQAPTRTRQQIAQLGLKLLGARTMTRWIEIL